MTDAGEKLRKTVAEFYQVDEEQVGPAFSLAARQGSIARAALDAAIRRRVGLKSRAVYSARTFGDLAAEMGLGLNGSASVPHPMVSGTQHPSPTPIGARPPGPVSCGVDIELIADLPIAADPWEDAFYRAQFSPAEIAYCLRQSEPSLHFAGRWCVKEALRKCDRAYLVAEGKDIEVVHDEAGAPHLIHHAADGPRSLPHAVSLSHSSHAAVAVVVRVAESPATVVGPATEAASSVAADSRPEPRRRGGKIALMIQLATLLVAALALYRTFPGH